MVLYKQSNLTNKQETNTEINNNYEIYNDIHNEIVDTTTFSLLG
jgi:hypothetical protein